MACRIIEVNQEGHLSVSSELLEHVRPYTRYEVSVRGNVIIPRPVDTPGPFRATASPREPADDLVQWTARHADGPGLPDDTLRREHLYDATT